MSSLLSLGKKLFKKDDDNDDDDSSGSSGGIFSALKSFDRDGDGKITENGNLTSLKTIYKKNNKKALQLFQDFILCAQRLNLGSVGDSTARSIFKKLDKNGNGQLDT